MLQIFNVLANENARYKCYELEDALCHIQQNLSNICDSK